MAIFASDANIFPMTKVTFFQQRRKDQAVRTGVEVNEETVLQRFSPGEGESDPALLWFIDLRFVINQSIATEAEAAKRFLMTIATPVRGALEQCAKEFQAGIDPDTWPARREIANLPPDVDGVIVSSAMRRLTLGEMGEAFTDLGQRWIDILASLEEVAEPTH
jgi:hypothetical protein